MGKYLFHGSYTEEGLKGVLKEGGSSRRKAIEHLVRGLGGTLELFYFAHGSDDFFIVADLPDGASAIAASLIVNATGTVRARMTALITPEEVDQATQITVKLRPPGQ